MKVLIELDSNLYSRVYTTEPCEVFVTGCCTDGWDVGDYDGELARGCKELGNVVPEDTIDKAVHAEVARLRKERHALTSWEVQQDRVKKIKEKHLDVNGVAGLLAVGKFEEAHALFIKLCQEVGDPPPWNNHP